MIQWLEKCCNKGDKQHFPLARILDQSLYYPASGFDGDPVKYFSHKINSFVYADYGYSENNLKDALASEGFKGYRIAHSRDVSQNVLMSDRWTSACGKNDYRYQGLNTVEHEKRFAKWLIFERCTGFGSMHGAQRFSLLYVCADGVAAYRALYMANNYVPKAIAIIQPGYGFGGNYTDFANPSCLLGEIVLGNNVGRPKMLLFGGHGKRNRFRSPCWPEYAANDGFYDKAGGGSIGVWLDSRV